MPPVNPSSTKPVHRYPKHCRLSEEAWSEAKLVALHTHYQVQELVSALVLRSLRTDLDAVLDFLRTDPSPPHASDARADLARTEPLRDHPCPP